MKGKKLLAVMLLT